MKPKRTAFAKLHRYCIGAVEPPDRSPPWAWLEKSISEIPYSPKAGKFSTSTTPWMRAPLEAIADDSKKLVMLLASVQSSKSLILHGAASWAIANAPAPMLYLLNTDEEAKDEAETRLQRLFASTPAVAKLYNANRHKNKNQSVSFSNGMNLWVLGQDSKNNLQRRSIRWLIGDETWLWKPGHIAEAMARTTAFGRLGKVILASQGSYEDDETDTLWRQTTQREWHYRCPDCGTLQPYRFENIEWSKDAKDDSGKWNMNRVRSTASLKCSHCGCYHDDNEHTRNALNKGGEYVRTSEEAPTENEGYHWNALAAISWGKIAVEYLHSKESLKRGEIELMQRWVQKRMGIAWKASHDDFKAEVKESNYTMSTTQDEWEEQGYLTAQRTFTTNKEEGIVKLRVMSVDVQMDCFYFVTRALSTDGKSRYTKSGKVDFWEQIEAVQTRYDIHPSFVFVDSGYGKKGEVYEQCAKNGWTALKGDGMRDRFPHRLPNGKVIHKFYSEVTKAGTPSGRIAKLHHFANLNVKDILDRIRRDPKRWQLPKDAPSEYLESLESEKRIKTKSGKWQWEQIGKRPNHYWDCEVMITAAMLMIKVIGSSETESE